MLGQMPRKADDLRAKIEQGLRQCGRWVKARCPAGVLGVDLLATSRPRRAGEAAIDILGQPEDLADLADRRPGAVGDDGGGEPGPSRPYFS
jgi:hypothetical protein